MNTRTDREPLFHALLDGTLDPEGEARVIAMLEIDAAARNEFAQLVELHVLLSSRAAPRGVSSPSRERESETRNTRSIPKMAGLSLYWLSAAAAVAVASNAALSAPPDAAGLDFSRDVSPVLEAHCGRCHVNTDALATTGTDALRGRLDAPTPCGTSLDENARTVLRRWLSFSLARV